MEEHSDSRKVQYLVCLAGKNIFYYNLFCLSALYIFKKEYINSNKHFNLKRVQ